MDDWQRSEVNETIGRRHCVMRDTPFRQKRNFGVLRVSHQRVTNYSDIPDSDIVPTINSMVISSTMVTTLAIATFDDADFDNDGRSIGRLSKVLDSTKNQIRE